MLYGGGFGLIIATVRERAEQYFLVILNVLKDGTKIPIHKWLGVHGGLNQIFMGSSNDNEIAINWENEGMVADKHVKIFIEKTEIFR